MAVFLTEKEKKKYKIYKKGSLPESNNILSHQAEAVSYTHLTLPTT